MNLPAFKTPQHIRIMEEAGHLLHRLFALLRAHMVAGRDGQLIERICLEYFREHGMRGVLKGYKGFPAHICVSVNEVAAHGVPDPTRFMPGDVVTVDIAVEYRGFCADAAWTYAIEPAGSRITDLVNAAWRTCNGAILAGMSEHSITAMGKAAQDTAHASGASILPQFGGHGIGRSLHEEPRFAFVAASLGPDLLPSGSVVNVEPVVCLGTDLPEVSRRGSAFVCPPGYRCAQFEHSLVLMPGGGRVMTLPGQSLLYADGPPF